MVTYTELENLQYNDLRNLFKSLSVYRALHRLRCVAPGWSVWYKEVMRQRPIALLRCSVTGQMVAGPANTAQHGKHRLASRNL